MSKRLMTLTRIYFSLALCRVSDAIGGSHAAVWFEAALLAELAELNRNRTDRMGSRARGLVTAVLVVSTLLLCAFVFSGCVADPSAAVDASDDACTCGSMLAPVTVANCSPQDDGSCVDAGTHEGSFEDLTAYLCPETPSITCTGSTFTVTCKGVETHVEIIGGGDASDAGECRVDLQ